jgi:hypothetical protein
VSTSCPCVCTVDAAFVEDCLGHANSQNTLISMCSADAIRSAHTLHLFANHQVIYKFF